MRSPTRRATRAFLGVLVAVAALAAASNALAVGTVPTTTTLLSSANPVVAGESVTFTAQVTGLGKAQPTGTVTFTNGSSTIATCASQPLTGGTTAATATCTVAPGVTQPAPDPIKAVYNGDSVNAASTSSGVLVNPAVTISVKYQAYGCNSTNTACPMSSTATVASLPPASGTPTGSVTFTGPGSGSSHTCRGSLSGGVSQPCTFDEPPGTYTINAVCTNSAGVIVGATTYSATVMARNRPVFSLLPKHHHARGKRHHKHHKRH